MRGFPAITSQSSAPGTTNQTSVALALMDCFSQGLTCGVEEGGGVIDYDLSETTKH